MASKSKKKNLQLNLIIHVENVHQRPAALHESVTAYDARCSGGNTLLNAAGNAVPIPPGCLLAAVSDGHYVNLETSIGTRRVRSSFNEVSKQLDPSVFISINRGIIINIEKITDIKNGMVTLKGSPKGELVYPIRKGAYKKTAELFLRYTFSGLTGQNNDD